MFWNEMREPDHIKGRPSQVGLSSKFPHSPKKHQPISIKKRKAQNHKII